MTQPAYWGVTKKTIVCLFVCFFVCLFVCNTLKPGSHMPPNYTCDIATGTACGTVPTYVPTIRSRLFPVHSIRHFGRNELWDIFAARKSPTIAGSGRTVDVPAKLNSSQLRRLAGGKGLR